MKKCILALVLATFVTLGYSKNPKWELIYEIKLVSAQLGDSIIHNADIPEYPSEYKDSVIKVNIAFIDRFYITIENKTNYAITINWDEIAYIDTNKKSNRVMHSGVRYIDRNEPQGYSLVAPKSIITDMFLPVDNVYYNSPTGNKGIEMLIGYKTGWQEIDILPRVFNKIEDRDKAVKAFAQKEISIYMPIVSNGVTIPYKFTYQIYRINVIQSKPKAQYYVTSIDDFPAK